MTSLLSFLTNKRIWTLYTILIRLVLRWKGIQIGENVRFEGFPMLKLNGDPRNISIGNNVTILGDIDLRNRENGTIIIHDNVTIEGGCRLVAAREGTITIGEHTKIGTRALINAGADVTIGAKCVFAANVNLNSSEHKHSATLFIQEQGFTHAPISIGEDCWLGINTVITKGVTLGKGVIVGASAVVTKDLDPFSINVGIPAKPLRPRHA